VLCNGEVHVLCIWREREREREGESMKISNAIGWLVVQLCSLSCSFLCHLALHTPLSLCKPLGTKSPKSGHPSPNWTSWRQSFCHNMYYFFIYYNHGILFQFYDIKKLMNFSKNISKLVEFIYARNKFQIFSFSLSENLVEGIHLQPFSKSD
jgi:hypothetical protein